MNEMLFQRCCPRLLEQVNLSNDREVASYDLLILCSSQTKCLAGLSTEFIREARRVEQDACSNTSTDSSFHGLERSGVRATNQASAFDDMHRRG